MRSQAVKVPVIAPVGIECEFWQEDDGWTGFCAGLTITVHGAAFEEAKKKMEYAIQLHVKSVLGLPDSAVKAE